MLAAGDVEGADSFYGTPKLARVRDYSRDGVLATLEDSMRRLHTDRIDIALIHDPDDHAEEALDGAYAALDQLRSEGTIRAVGVGMNQAPLLEWFVERADLDCVLVAGRYSLLDTAAAAASSRPASGVAPGPALAGCHWLAGRLLGCQGEGGCVPSGTVLERIGGMRFAFKTAPQNTTWPDMLAVWKEADDIEIFESGWTFDHFYPIFSDSAGPCLEGWMTLAALAQATRRLRLGTLVTGIHYRHPAVLANMAATLDIVSGGRLELGIGAGWNEEESGAYGIELGSPAERSDRFEEACEVIVSLLTRPDHRFHRPVLPAHQRAL